MDEKTPASPEPTASAARWTERFHLEGRSGGQAAVLELDSGGVRWARSGDDRFLPLGQLLDLRIVPSGVRTLLSVLGTVCAALGVLWLLDSALPQAAALGAIVVGLLALVAARLWPRCAIALRAEGLEARLECSGTAARAAREAVGFARFCAPKLRRKPRSVLSFIGAELSAVTARERVLRWEYRAIAEKPEPELEARFVRVRRKIAAWNLFWILVVPAGLALAQYAAFPASSAAWGYVRAVVVLVLGGLAGMRLLPRLQPLLARWVR